MAKDQTEALRPGIHVAVEMDKPDRPLSPGQCTQQRECDRVIAAKGNEVPDGCRLLLELG